MKLISHRGNINGPFPLYENRPEYIDEAMRMGYDVEIDVWRIDGNLFLGHDSPTYQINEKFIFRSGLLCHAKNADSFNYMLKNKNTHCFWHQEDTYTLTSFGIPVVYPNKEPIENSIVMIRGTENYFEIFNNKIIYGICSDTLIMV